MPDKQGQLRSFPSRGDRSAKSLNGETSVHQEAALEELDTGKVYLVGSGPGDPELLTIKAWRVLREADVVLHDSLTGDEIIDRISESVKVVDVGKRSKERTEQHEIHSLMREKTQKGKTVVRLKGGDPYVFGRGGEETEYLASHDIDFEVVPGISSVLAAPDIARIPLTHRDYASSFTVITGHEDPTKDESSLDWTALARNLVTGGTLIILMGVRRLPDNVTTLLENDVPPETPAAMIEKATWSDEQTVTGTLGTIVERSQAVGIEPPAVTVIGDVVRVRQEMEEWFTA